MVTVEFVIQVCPRIFSKIIEEINFDAAVSAVKADLTNVKAVGGQQTTTTYFGTVSSAKPTKWDDIPISSAFSAEKTIRISWLK